MSLRRSVVRESLWNLGRWDDRSSSVPQRNVRKFLERRQFFAQIGFLLEIADIWQTPGRFGRSRADTGSHWANRATIQGIGHFGV